MNKKTSNRKIEILGFSLIVLSIFTFLSLIATSPYGSPSGGHDGCSMIYTFSKQSDNITGTLGDTFYCFLRYKGFGLASFLIPIMMFLWGIALIKKSDIKKNMLRSAHILLAIIFFSIYSAAFTDGSPNWSGKFGSSMYGWLHNRLDFGLWILGVTIVIIYVSVIFNISIYKIFEILIKPVFRFFSAISNKINSYFEKRKIKRKEALNQVSISIDKEDEFGFEDKSETVDIERLDDSKENNEILENNKKVEENFNDSELAEASGEEELNIKEDSLDLDDDNIQIIEEKEIDEIDLDKIKERKAKLFNYKLPTSDLLDSPVQIKTDISEEVLRARGEELVDALSSFGVEGKIVEIKKGPVITLYEIEPAEGVRVNKFTNLSDDLARVMKAQRIRVLAPIPGTKYIGIELPNENPQIVYLKNILNSKKYAESNSKLTIGVGKTTMGDEFCFDLQKMPHLLVAGATGAGKSVCINTIIVSILYKAKPNEVKFILIDPKKLELATYKSLVGYHLITAPGLDEYVMTTAENAVGILDSAITEMERRFEIFASARVRNIQEYHDKQKVDPNLEEIPYIVILIDELADLMMTSGRAVEDPITRLAQKARAVGLHLVVATQRPSVDVITGLIKSNFPARISFQVSSKIDSRTILDQMGAETLLGRGDMLFLPPGSASPIRLHNAFITLDEIEKIMNHISSQPKPQEVLLPEMKKDNINSDFSTSDDDRDELLFDAAKLVIQNQQASVSLLQRRLKIGYSRAGRLIDELEALGVVSGYSGSKARDVLVDESYLDKIFN